MKISREAYSSLRQRQSASSKSFQRSTGTIQPSHQVLQGRMSETTGLKISREAYPSLRQQQPTFNRGFQTGYWTRLGPDTKRRSRKVLLRRSSECSELALREQTNKIFHRNASTARSEAKPMRLRRLNWKRSKKIRIMMAMAEADNNDVFGFLDGLEERKNERKKANSQSGKILHLSKQVACHAPQHPVRGTTSPLATSRAGIEDRPERGAGMLRTGSLIYRNGPADLGRASRVSWPDILTDLSRSLPLVQIPGMILPGDPQHYEALAIRRLLSHVRPLSGDSPA